MSNLKKCKSSLTQYKCSKCRDLTFIFKEDGAAPCECRALIEAQNIIKNSGISESFRKMTLENFNYRLNKQAIEGFTTASKYVNNIGSIINSRENSILFCGKVGSEKTCEELLYIDEAIGSRIIEMSNGYIVENKGSKSNYRLLKYFLQRK